MIRELREWLAHGNAYMEHPEGQDGTGRAVEALDALLAGARGAVDFPRSEAPREPCKGPSADWAGLLLAADLVVEEMKSGAGITQIAFEALEEGVAMVRRLRKDDTPEGKQIWNSVDRCAADAPQWVKDRLSANSEAPREPTFSISAASWDALRGAIEGLVKALPDDVVMNLPEVRQLDDTLTAILEREVAARSLSQEGQQ